MTDVDVRLRALFDQDMPPARDVMFSATVMASLARHRLWVDLAWLLGVASLGGLILWAMWPAILPVLTSLNTVAPTIAACLTLAFVAWILVDDGLVVPLGPKHDQGFMRNGASDRDRPSL